MARPPRVRGFDYRGFHRYFLTFCTHERAPHFTDRQIVDLVVDQILRTAREQRFEVTAYCVMPDHVHLLAGGLSANSDLRALAGRAKQWAAQRFTRATGQRLWQPGYHEYILREGQSSRGFIEYIVCNPLRAQLVTRPEDYPFWGSQRYTRDELLAIVRDSDPDSDPRGT